MSIQQMLLGGSGVAKYNLERSLRFRASASAYLNRTPSGSGSRTTWTFNAWVKRGALTGTNYTILRTNYVSTSELYFRFDINTDRLAFSQYEAGGSSNNFGFLTTQRFRDPSAWYMITLVWDTTNATSTDRIRLYINGVRVTAFDSTFYPTLNYAGIWNASSWINYICYDPSGWYYDGYLAEVNFIDGQALTPASFGEYNAITGVWQPKAYTGTYGTNGFYLPFTNTTSVATLGNDFSGNGNTWTVNNISLTAGVTYDSMTDVPTLTSATAANFAVLNPLHNPNTSIVTYNGANLNYSYPSGSTNQQAVVSTIGMTSGKFYWEFTEGSSVNSFIGVTTGIVYGGGGNGAQYAATGGGISGSSAATYSGTALTTVAGNVVGLAFDANALTLAVYKNNVLQGTFSGIESGKTWFMLIAAYAGGSAGNGSINFGQRPFAYTPPTGFVALNTFNLPAASIVKGNEYMDATLYTGNGSTQTITNAAGFQPDLVWVKTRSSGSFGHAWFDSVRGAPRRLASNLTEAENTTGSFGQVSSFNLGGFTVATGSSSFGETGLNALTYVGWQWKAGGTAVSNTAGSITSQVSANTSAGFSVVTYTGTGANATVGHGLGVAPSMIIVKARNQSYNWNVYSASIAANQFLRLNTTDGVQASNDIWNSTRPTSSVFSLGNAVGVNGSGDTHVAYCFAPIAGYSAFGNYAGNGSTDGPFVYLGFRPKFVMIKCFGAAASWVMLDSARDVYNPETNGLLADNSAAEGSGYLVDFLSNGFKVKNTGSGTNSAGTGYIYAAFAENPFKFSLAR